MSVRAIASVGVMLCAAVTSFSTYLGVIEHAYSPAHIRVVTLVSRAVATRRACRRNVRATRRRPTSPRRRSGRAQRHRPRRSASSDRARGVRCLVQGGTVHRT